VLTVVLTGGRSAFMEVLPCGRVSAGIFLGGHDLRNTVVCCHGVAGGSRCRGDSRIGAVGFEPTTT
jgi:hypothetical protein